MAIAVLSQVLTNNSSVLLDYWFYDFHLDSRRGDGGESKEENGKGWALPVVLVVIADDIRSACGVGEEDSEPLRASHAHGDLISFLEGSRGFTGLFELHERELGKDLDLLHDAVVGHDVDHLLSFEVLGNSAKP